MSKVLVKNNEALGTPSPPAGITALCDRCNSTLVTEGDEAAVPAVKDDPLGRRVGWFITCRVCGYAEVLVELVSIRPHDDLLS